MRRTCGKVQVGAGLKPRDLHLAEGVAESPQVSGMSWWAKAYRFANFSLGDSNIENRPGETKHKCRERDRDVPFGVVSKRGRRRGGYEAV